MYTTPKRNPKPPYAGDEYQNTLATHMLM